MMAHLLLLLGIMTSPYYFLPSGMPQPAHWILFTAGLITFFQRRYTVPTKTANILKPLLLFIGYVMVVNIAHALYFALVLEDSSMVGGRVESLFVSAEPITYALFYLFNLLIVVLVLSVGGRFNDIGKRERFWKGIFIAASVASIVLAGLTVVGVGRTFKSSYRAILFFNNPNQLGYFSVLIASLIFFSFVQLRRMIWLAAVGYFCALYLATLALSKAALVAILILPVIFFLGGRTAFKAKAAMAVLVLLLGVIGGMVVDEQVFERLERRFVSVGEQSDDSLEGRAYDRVLHYPEYLAFGAGEGLRMPRFGVGAEIHSLFATVLFSYGVVGFVLLSFFLWRLYRELGFAIFSYLIPAALYNLTHNGIRNPLLWILLAMMLFAVSKRDTDVFAGIGARRAQNGVGGVS